MATVLDTLYPPQVETFMPSFIYNDSAKVYFKFSSYDEDKIDKVKYIHVSMVDQRTNQNVFAGIQNNKVVYPQYYPVRFTPNYSGEANGTTRTGYDNTKEMYWVSIPKNVLKTSNYNINQYYKIQLRFDLTGSVGYPAYSTSYANPTSFFPWNGNTANALQLTNYTNYNQNNFSEWSVGTLIRPIAIPTLKLSSVFNTNNIINIKKSTDVLIQGKITFSPARETEQLSWYQIKILSLDNSIIYYDSYKIFPSNVNIIYSRIDTSMLTIGNKYYVQIIYETEHGYNENIIKTIQIQDYANKKTNLNCISIKDEEKGSITLNITTNYSSGNLIIRRASHRTNFSHWDLIAAYKISSTNHDFNIIDNSIESMVGYKYQIQYINNLNELYEPWYTEILHCDFYGSIFSDNERTLILTFNFQLSNVTNAMNRTKVDTLGGQYPIFVQNPKLKYHTYAIGGRISTEDAGENFLPKEELFGSLSDENSYYNYRYNPSVSSPHSSECQRIKPWNDWLYEREYRDAVEEWLNNGKPKLFRSMTEGNKIVILDGISLTPDSVLGRRLYDFSATMYEIEDGKNLDTIVSFKLFNLIDDRN